MRRRDFMALVSSAAVALPTAAHAQEPGKVLRVGVVSGVPRDSSLWQTFEHRLVELGYQDGKNFVFEMIAAQTIDGYESGYRELATR